MTHQPIPTPDTPDRRRFLKGMGVSLALPWMHSALAPSARAAVDAAGGNAPIRSAFLYFPNGVWEKAWVPETQGPDYELTPSLQPIAPVRDDVLVLTGLDKKHSHGGDGHYAKTANFLTGMPVTKTTSKDISSGGISVDQMIAKHQAGQTPIPSLELATEPVVSGIDSNVGYTRLYGSYISWETPNRPVAKEMSPRIVYDRLFGHASKTSHEESESYTNLLDYVLEDAKRVRGRLGRDDQFKMDEYLDAVRAVERRIEHAAHHGGRDWEPSVDPVEIARRRPGVPNDFREHIDVMLDLMVLAFQTDSTRVASFMFANDVSGRNFSFLDGVAGGHHEMSHHENKEAKISQYQQITHWHVQQFARLLEKMKGIREGESTLLDNSMILFGSSISDGNRHDPDNLPILVGGRAGGKFNSGRHIAYKDVPLCNLYHSMLNASGIDVESFGDSTGPLTELS
ncbi:hypothetical protein Pla52o_52830 [Novipirellula galeiformis]|uniref:DUF1552 domain-containing protein n=1 Tax=Novipirellula galeiformis TaxID=2528004 RepID=A0A5C6BZZ2_9BACT|nr:DUF1552 domain-containing protein [Novipirellula galeiformis]TWU17277.1 hypothetical protein Pla52o_52830 [Novipirellula galeiformis]